jgi:hypothetical protein
LAPVVASRPGTWPLVPLVEVASTLTAGPRP